MLSFEILKKHFSFISALIYFMDNKPEELWYSLKNKKKKLSHCRRYTYQ